jgi:hypothetical protein
MALWLRADDSINVTDSVHASKREGVSFDGGQCYDFLHREQPYLRLGFTRYDETQLEEAVRRMARALSRLRPIRPAFEAPRCTAIRRLMTQDTSLIVTLREYSTARARFGPGRLSGSQ